MIDIFQKAADNSPSLTEWYRDFQTTNGSNQITQFCDWFTNNARLGINVSMAVVLEMSGGRKYMNTYESVEELSTLCGRSPDTILQERLHKFYDRRIEFDNSFVNGKYFLYSAINVNGIGLSQYAPFCLIIRNDYALTINSTACVLGDTLTICYTTGSLNTDVILGHTVPYQTSSYLLAREYSAEIITNLESWEELVQKDRRYVEVILISDIYIKDVEEIRMAQKDYAQYWKMAFGNFGLKQDDATKALVHSFISMIKKVRSGSFKLSILH